MATEEKMAAPPEAVSLAVWVQTEPDASEHVGFAPVCAYGHKRVAADGHPAAERGYPVRDRQLGLLHEGEG